MEDLTWADLRESLRFDEVLTDLGIDPVPATRKGWQNSSCPLPSHHGIDASPSFGVNEDSLSFKCWTCDEAGNLVRLVELMRGVSRDAALLYLLEFSDADTDDDTQMLKQIDRWFVESEVERTRAVVLPYFHPEALHGFPFARLGQLTKWGLHDPDTAVTFGIRYDAQHTRGTYTGPALLIPHRLKNELLGWQQRWLDEDRPDWVAKYTNTSDFPRQETLYNYDRACNFDDFVVVVESVATVWRLFELGFTAVATFGSSVTETQLRLLRNLNGVVLCLDGDARKQTRAVVQALEDDTTVYLLPQLGAKKADLADLPDAEILAALSSIRYAALD